MIRFLLILSLMGLVVGCSKDEPIEIKPIVKPNIPIQPRPEGLSLADVKFHVVNKDNLEEFISSFESQKGYLVFIAISVEGYENLSLNMQELRRYISQQKQLLVYYETSITDTQ